MNIAIDIKTDILSVADQYNTLFLDVCGVLYDGIKISDDTLDTLRRLKKQGKKIIIVSNSTQIKSDAEIDYNQRGMFQDTHFDEIVTSGEFLRYTILEGNPAFSKIMDLTLNTMKCLFMGNANIFADSYISKADSYDDTDFVYVGVPRASYGSVRIDDLFDEKDNRVNMEDVIEADWRNLKDSHGRQGPLEFVYALEPCLRSNKTLLVANPDIFAHGTVNNNSKKVPIFTQGCIGRYYEKLGGKVVYFGKPYKGIFDYAKHRYTSANDKILMVGDTPWADILGANLSGIDSALVISGVSMEFLEKMPEDMDENTKINVLLNEINNKMANIQESSVPTYIIRQFAFKQ